MKYPLLHSMIALLLLIMTNVHAQQKVLLSEAEKLVFSEPAEAIKIGKHLLGNTTTVEEQAEVAMLLSRAYTIQGNLDAAVESIFIGRETIAQLSSAMQIRYTIQKAAIFRTLFLDVQYQKHMQYAQEMLAEMPTGNTKDSLSVAFIFAKIYTAIERNRFDEAKQQLKTTATTYTDFLAKHPKLMFYWQLLHAKVLNSCDKNEEALRLLQQLYARVTTDKANGYLVTVLSCEIGNWYSEHQQYLKAEEVYTEALIEAQQLGNVLLQERIVNELTTNFLALDNEEKYKEYSTKLLVLDNQQELVEQEAVNTLYGLVTAEKNEALAAAKNAHYTKVLELAFAVLLILLICGFWLWRSNASTKRLQEIISYIEVTKKNFLKPTVKKVKAKKTLNIPSETEEAILEKLKRFEKSTKFTSSDMSLAVLAGQFDTNTKYLSEIINKHYNDNFNTFINKLRINYIIQKLQTDPNYSNYKISFLAEQSGFSSHSNFATVFKSIVGMTPATFINLLKEDQDHEQSTSGTT